MIYNSMFWVHKRNVSFRRFFYALKNPMFDREKLIIIILGCYMLNNPDTGPVYQLSKKKKKKNKQIYHAV